MRKFIVIERKDKTKFDKQELYEAMFYREYTRDGDWKTTKNLIKDDYNSFVRGPLCVFLQPNPAIPFCYYSKYTTGHKMSIVYNTLLSAHIKKFVQFATEEDVLPVIEVMEREIKDYIGCDTVKYDPFDEWTDRGIKREYPEKTDESKKYYSAPATGLLGGITDQISELGISIGEFMFNPNYGIMYIEGRNGQDNIFSKMLREGIINRDAIANIDMIERILSECKE
jgi:hypothetical protein